MLRPFPGLCSTAEPRPRLENVNIHLPKADDKETVLADYLGERNGFPKVSAGHKDSSVFNHTVAGLSDVCLKRLAKTKHDGGNRLDWANDPELQLPCFVGKDDCFKDTFGRMWWHRPASTITTKFYSISNGRFGHPEEDRALSLRFRDVTFAYKTGETVLRDFNLKVEPGQTIAL